MTDVHELLTRTQRVLGEAEAPLDPTTHDHLLSGIRRRRRRRHVGEVLGVTAGVVVLGTVAWLGVGRGTTPQPADPPAPTASPTAAPSADPTPTPTTAAELVPAPGAPGLLPASVLPEGTLETATTGWVLTTQRPTYVTADFGDAVAAHVLDLVSPDGARYRVLDLPPETRVDVVRWTAGEGQAIVRLTGDGTTTSGPARLDLRTGEVTALDGLGEFATYVGRSADGADLWTDEGAGELLVHDGASVVATVEGVVGEAVDASGTWVAGRDGDSRVLVVDVATREVTVALADGGCSPVAWSGADLLLTCVSYGGEYPQVTQLLRYDAQAADGTVEVDVTGADGLPQPGPHRGVDLGGGRVATPFTRSLDCADGWGVLDLGTGALTPVPSAADDNRFVLRVSGQAVYAEAASGCSGDATPSRLLRYDVGTGASVELAGPPPAADLPAGARSWLVGTSSWVVAD